MRIINVLVGVLWLYGFVRLAPGLFQGAMRGPRKVWECLLALGACVFWPVWTAIIVVALLWFHRDIWGPANGR